MTQTATKPQPDIVAHPDVLEVSLPQSPDEDLRERQAQLLRLLWNYRRPLFRAAVIGLLASAVIALIIPNSYTSTSQLMPPDPQSASGMALAVAAYAAKNPAIGNVAGDLLGLKSTGALFVGVLKSQTAQDRLVQQFDLRRVYGKRLVTDARIKLDENTSISEDRKSGIISISVSDRSPERAAALTRAYVDQLNSLVAELSTSSAHRERVFLEDRLKVVKQALDSASNELAHFSSENSTLDIQQEGKAMLDTAAVLAGQLIAAQSQLEGLRQIYTDKNPRIQSLNARVAELRRNLGRLSGSNGRIAQTPNASDELPYPSIRNLPLLGVKYADYYQNTKIQATVYELLTEQYELAKVQEAKEIPSIKVLDPAGIPEKKSFPPRLVFVVLGAMFAVCVYTSWIVGSRRWNQADADDPRKLLAQEVFATVKARTAWMLRNGDGSVLGYDNHQQDESGSSVSRSRSDVRPK